MSKLEIVPFGKYKGQPVEALAQDREYCEWLAEQDWFRVKFPTIHTLIINNFGAPEETPEHNALQALFVDKAFLRRFLVHVLGWDSIRELAHQRKGRARIELEHTIYDIRHAVGIQRREENERRGALAQAEHELEAMLQAPDADFDASARFEVNGMDVLIECHVMLGPVSVGEVPVHVECKPSVGDDYPAIIRQMMSADDAFNYRRVLFIGQGGYTGVGATFEQMKAIFASRGITIVLQNQMK